MPSDIRDDVTFTKTVTISGSLSMPDGTVTGDKFSAVTTSRLPATKLESQYAAQASVVATSDKVTTGTQILHTVYGSSGTLVGFDAVIAATTNSVSYVVDLLKHSSGSTGTSCLQTTITVSSGSSPWTRIAGVVQSSDAGLVTGDMLRAVWASTGGSTDALGLHVSAILREQPS